MPSRRSFTIPASISTLISWERVGWVMWNASRISQPHSSPHESISTMRKRFGSEIAFSIFAVSTYICSKTLTPHRSISICYYTHFFCACQYQIENFLCVDRCESVDNNRSHICTLSLNYAHPCTCSQSLTGWCVHR